MPPTLHRNVPRILNLVILSHYFFISIDLLTASNLISPSLRGRYSTNDIIHTTFRSAITILLYYIRHYGIVRSDHFPRWWSSNFRRRSTHNEGWND